MKTREGAIRHPFSQTTSLLTGGVREARRTGGRKCHDTTIIKLADQY